MKTFLIYIVLAVSGGVEIKINTSIPPFYNLNECKQYVVKNSATILGSAQSAFKGKKIAVKQMGSFKKGVFEKTPCY